MIIDYSWKAKPPLVCMVLMRGNVILHELEICNKKTKTLCKTINLREIFYLVDFAQIASFPSTGPHMQTAQVTES